MSHQNAEPPAVATDLTTCYGFLAYLNREVDSGWARDNYLDITALTLTGAKISVPLPSADKLGPTFALFPLQKLFGIGDVHHLEKREERDYQKQCLQNDSYKKELQDYIDDLLRQTSCKIWLSWHNRHEWREHIYRCQGLVEKCCEDLVSELVPEQTTANIIAINKEAFDNPERFSENATDSHRRVYTADVVRRGLVYRHVCAVRNLQQLLHQTRRIPPPPKDPVRQREHILGFEPFLLADIIREHTDNADTGWMRVGQWVEAVESVRHALKRCPRNLGRFQRTQGELDSAAKLAGKIADKLELSAATRTVHRWARILGAGIGGGIGAAVALLLASYLDFLRNPNDITRGIAIFAGGFGGAMLGQAIPEWVVPILMKRDSDPRVAALRLAKRGPEYVRSSMTLDVPSEAPPSQ
jgi:hypothetical protein